MADPDFSSFELITGSIVIGLAIQETAENALPELRLGGLEFRAPLFHGDTLTAYDKGLIERRRQTAKGSHADD